MCRGIAGGGRRGRAGDAGSAAAGADEPMRAWLALFTEPPRRDGRGGAEVSGTGYRRCPVEFAFEGAALVNVTGAVFGPGIAATVVAVVAMDAPSGGRPSVVAPCPGLRNGPAGGPLGAPGPVAVCHWNTLHVAPRAVRVDHAPKDGPWAAARPCRDCPWRRDVPTGNFGPAAFARIADCGAPRILARTMMCHKAPDRACAGFLAVHGAAHGAARLAVAAGALRPEACGTGDDPALYGSFAEMAVANGVAADDPALPPLGTRAGCRRRGRTGDA